MTHSSAATTSEAPWTLKLSTEVETGLWQSLRIAKDLRREEKRRFARRGELNFNAKKGNRQGRQERQGIQKA